MGWFLFLFGGIGEWERWLLGLRVCRLLGSEVDLEGVFCGTVKEVDFIVIVLAVFDRLEEGRFLGVFGDFVYVLVREQGFSHFGEFALFAFSDCFSVVVGVGEGEVGAAFAAEKAAVEVFVELLDGFGVACEFFVSVTMSVKNLRKIESSFWPTHRAEPAVARQPRCRYGPSLPLHQRLLRRCPHHWRRLSRHIHPRILGLALRPCP